ncbi:MAG: hypothetical protein J6W75_12500 [Bacteroidaceae bacterium]|nr:hypothetical protein [Bacteroidaceae bacterium]
MKEYPHLEDEAPQVQESVAAYASSTSTVFNPSQQLLLRMFAYDSSEEGLKDLQHVLTTHYRDLADKALNELWDSGQLDQSRLSELRGMHIRDILKN